VRESEFRPGDHVRWFAKLRGWEIAENTVIVEGETDQRYFQLADRHYTKKTEKQLICNRFGIVPVGIGPDGGTYNIANHFPTFRNIVDNDTTPDGRKLYHSIALLDDDQKGKFTYKALTGRHTNFRKNRDIFLLKRSLPRNTRDIDQLTNAIARANNEWRQLDCEIEDLINIELLESFIDENSDSVVYRQSNNRGVHHIKFKDYAKASLFSYVEKMAMYEDMTMMIEVLRSLRYYVGLDDEGETLQ
jgi:hypothetical protein